MMNLPETFAEQIKTHRRHVGTLIGYYIVWCSNYRYPHPEISRSKFRSTRLWELAEVCDVLLIEEEEEQRR